ncbi:3,4-dihydroxy-2-butanone-4-phosphate synthase [Sinomonas halotolerans]|uniref:3,4-dihydroxy-2-butanone 4-phosphate synthase n=1 Tax=Sinomonas halotolerans TaxID=1644133 RepID=A0ABU9X1E1_9MICC
MSASVQAIRLEPVSAAIEALRAGRPVLAVDDEDRENEGDIIFAAEHSTPALMGWTIRHSSGVVCAPMDARTADRLALPPMVVDNQDAKGTAYTVSCDLAGTGTGISATARSQTVAALASDTATAGDFTRPGHIFPLRAVDGGVLARAGHTEAAVDLCRLAGLSPVAVIAEVVHDDGEMMRLPALREFADEHGCPLISIEELAAYMADRGTQGGVS